MTEHTIGEYLYGVAPDITWMTEQYTPELIAGLYGIEPGTYDTWRRCPQFRVVRRTPRRVYYAARPDGSRVRFADRQALERDGEVTIGRRTWWAADRTLCTSPAALAETPQEDAA